MNRLLIALLFAVCLPFMAHATATPDFILDVGKSVGDSVSAQSKLRMFDGDTTSSREWIRIQPPSNLTASWDFTLPPDNGDPGDVLTTNGSGVATWDAPAGAYWQRVSHDIDGFTVDTLLPVATDDVVRVESASNTDPAFAGGVTGDTEVRWFRTVGGVDFYGDGTGSYAVRLGPVASDDRMALGTGDALTIGSTAGDHGSTTNGTFSYNSTSNKMRVYEGGSWKDVVQTGGGSSPLTTKGDIYTYSAADDRLPVGVNGEVLSADSTTATGLKWVAASGGAPTGATYITQTADAGLSAEQALTSLADGYMKKTAGGVVTTQAVPIPLTDGGTNNTAFTVDHIAFSNGSELRGDAGLQFQQGGNVLTVGEVGNDGDIWVLGATSGQARITAQNVAANPLVTLPTVDVTMPTAQATATNKFLKADTSGNQSYVTIDAGDVTTGTLPVSRGGTGNTAFTVAGIAYSDGTILKDDAARLGWQDGAGATDSFLIIKNGSLSGGYIRFNEDSDNGTNRTQLKGADNMAANVDVILPTVATTEVAVQATSTSRFLASDTAGVRAYEKIEAGGSTTGDVTFMSSTYGNANSSIAATDFIAVANVTFTAARTYTLPAVATFGANRVLVVKSAGAVNGANTLIIDGSGAETIDGAATVTISTARGSYTLYCDGTTWHIW